MNEFCGKLTIKGHREGWLAQGWQVDLPTEAQWEYACRAGTESRFSFGDEESRLGLYAWFDQNTGGAGEPYAHPVGQKRPNPWGLYDMHGNVWESCRDWFADRLPAGTDPENQDQALYRVFRGGSWFGNGQVCRSAHRGRNTSGYRVHALGFRVAVVQSGAR